MYLEPDYIMYISNINISYSSNRYNIILDYWNDNDYEDCEMTF